MSIFETLTSLFAPNDCLGCGREGDLLCIGCTQCLPPLPGRCFGCYCRLKSGAGCSGCLARVGLSYLHASVGYDGLASSLIAQLKFHGNQSAGRQIAKLMLTGLQLPHTALLTHIPATTRHIRQRGYDQAELMTRQISRQTGCRQVSLLARSGQVHQLGADREARLRQLRLALRIKNQAPIINQQIILIDDVLTTGATLSTTAQLLLAAGARRVDALVFAQA